MIIDDPDISCQFSVHGKENGCLSYRPAIMYECISNIGQRYQREVAVMQGLEPIYFKVFYILNIDRISLFCGHTYLVQLDVLCFFDNNPGFRIELHVIKTN